MRVSVTGIRGKSTFVGWCEEIFRSRGFRTLAKVTGDVDPHWIHNGNIIPVVRPRKVVLLDETTAFRDYEHDVLVAENQAISPYTMRVFNTIVQPDVIAVTNIRLDHTDTMGESKERIAESIGFGFTKCQAVASGEADDGLNAILERHASRVKARFLIEPPSNELNPLAPLMELTDATLAGLGLTRLSTGERELLQGNIHRECCYVKGPETALWFDGAKINDVDSAEQMLRYLLTAYPDVDFSLVAYFRSDRPGRTEAFAPWLAEKSRLQRVKRVLLAGAGSGFVARRLALEKVRAINEHLGTETIIGMCAGSVMFLAVNAVNNFMQRLKERLKTAGAILDRGGS